MRVTSIVPLVVGVLASTAIVSATEGAQRQNPYARLFAGQLNGAPAPSTPVPTPRSVPFPTAGGSAPNRTVICGMTVVQGDAKIDPAMPHKPPANAPKAVIEIIPAPACRK